MRKYDVVLKLLQDSCFLSFCLSFSLIWHSVTVPISSARKPESSSTKTFLGFPPMASGQAFLLLLFLTLIISNVSSQSIIQIWPENRIADDRLPRSDDDSSFCDSWRLSVETNNAGYWSTIQVRCVSFVEDYVTGHRYLSDSDVASGDSLSFAKTVETAGDGLDAWVFDIDETLLSNVPYYQAHGFG